MAETGNGRYETSLSAEGSGLVRLRSGQLTTVAALGPINPAEYADLRPTRDVLEPFVAAGLGGSFAVGDGADANLPSLRRTRAGSDQAGRNWLGLTRNERYIVRTSSRTPLLPGLPVVLVLSILLGLGWWREGR